VVVGNKLFLTASYGIGALWADLEPNQINIVWSSDDLLSSQYTTSVAHEGMLYGIHGRQDAGRAELRCVDPVKREVKWKVTDFGTANLILADGKLIIVKTDGEIVLAKPTRDKFVELARAKPFGDRAVTLQALPALAEGRLYVRDERELKCLDLRAKK